jgi:hypothetical protein
MPYMPLFSSDLTPKFNFNNTFTAKGVRILKNSNNIKDAE